MRIKILVLSLLFVSCIAKESESKKKTADVMDVGIETGVSNDIIEKFDTEVSASIPTNCRKFDGDPVGCAENGCNAFFDQGPTICVVNGICTRDNNGSGACAHYDPEYANNGIGWGYYRAQDDFVVESGQAPVDIGWIMCPESGGSAACECFWADDEQQQAGSCP